MVVVSRVVVVAGINRCICVIKPHEANEAAYQDNRQRQKKQRQQQIRPLTMATANRLGISGAYSLARLACSQAAAHGRAFVLLALSWPLVSALFVAPRQTPSSCCGCAIGLAVFLLHWAVAFASPALPPPHFLWMLSFATTRTVGAFPLSRSSHHSPPFPRHSWPSLHWRCLFHLCRLTCHLSRVFLLAHWYGDRTSPGFVLLFVSATLLCFISVVSLLLGLSGRFIHASIHPAIHPSFLCPILENSS